jgi:hypothetical protein
MELEGGGSGIFVVSVDPSVGRDRTVAGKCTDAPRRHLLVPVQLESGLLA